MKAVLTKNGYSKAQLVLFDLLPKDGSKITTKELVEKRQAREKANWPVDFPRQIVTSTMQILIERVTENRESFRIRKSHRCGPRPITYWIVPARGASNG
jgi:ATP-dependent DNA ligase